MSKEVIVKEAMNTNIATVKHSTTVFGAAKIMKKRNVGSVIVIQDKHPIGILTESDILEKLVAEGKKPEDTTVAEIMTAPVLISNPYVTLEKAMDKMGKCNIRRLPVVENGDLIGIITERDILRISPVLHEIAQQWYEITSRDETFYKQQVFSGKCEDCNTLSANLKNVDGRLLCEDCIDALKYE